MRKILAILLCAVMLVGCGNNTIDSNNDISGGNAEESIEYSYAELIEYRDKFVDFWLDETGKLSDAETFGLSDDEEERNEHYFAIAAECANKIAERNPDIPIGKRVTITGYIDGITELNPDGFFARKGAGNILFYLKHNADNEKYDGFSCKTDDTKFLDLESNTAIKIEGVFCDPEMCGSNNDLYECKIIEIGETENVSGKNTSVPTTAAAVKTEDDIFDAFLQNIISVMDGQEQSDVLTIQYRKIIEDSYEILAEMNADEALDSDDFTEFCVAASYFYNCFDENTYGYTLGNACLDLIEFILTENGDGDEILESIKGILDQANK